MPSKTIMQWCASHHLSRTMFYKLRNSGKGPRIMKIGSVTRISDEADAAWCKAREAESLVLSPAEQYEGAIP